jgi:plastocyanin
MKNKIALVMTAFCSLVLLGQGCTPSRSPEAAPDSPAPPAAESERPSRETTNVITYTDNGFTPGSITVTIGTTVAFVNQSPRGMWVASAIHPSHLELPGFDALRSYGTGEQYTYTFTKAGTWGFHNHVNARHTGSVTVTP